MSFASPKNLTASFNNIVDSHYKFSKRIDEKCFDRVKSRLSQKKEIDLKSIIINKDGKKNTDIGNNS
jgi:hypothetical protein